MNVLMKIFGEPQKGVGSKSRRWAHLPNPLLGMTFKIDDETTVHYPKNAKPKRIRPKVGWLHIGRTRRQFNDSKRKAEANEAQ